MRFNWSKSFVSYLYALCREYYDLIESKKSDSKAWKEKDENWAEILGHIDARSKIDDPESILKKSNCVDKRSVHKKAAKVYSDKKSHGKVYGESDLWWISCWRPRDQKDLCSSKKNT